jgi:hypothetical protein
VRVAKAGVAISNAESAMARLARDKDTLIHLIKTGFASYLAQVYSSVPHCGKRKIHPGPK